MQKFPDVGHVFKNVDVFHEHISTKAIKDGFRIYSRRSSCVKGTKTPKHKVYACHRFGPSTGINSKKSGCPLACGR